MTELVVNKDKEVIGATLLYESNYQSNSEIKQAEQRIRTEEEATRVFWNGNAVPDESNHSVNPE